MNIKPILICGFSLTVLSLSSLALAQEQPIATQLEIQKDKIFIPDQLNIDSVSMYEKEFNFDWNEPATIAPNRKKVADIEAFIQQHPNFSQLTPENKAAMGRILYKLGTYYTHVTPRPKLAIERLNQAAPLLTNKNAKAWNYDQLAYAYKLKFEKTESIDDKNKALNYSQKVIKLYSAANNREVAFAYYIQGLVENEVGDYAQAQTDLNKALTIYEALPGGKDMQYARTKNQLAAIILEQGNNDKEALAILEELQRYWSAKKNMNNNPYAAQNLLSLGEAYLQVGDPKAAKKALDDAITIYARVYGYNSPQLIEPYQDLADAYKQIGDDKKVEAYLSKANKVDNG